MSSNCCLRLRDVGVRQINLVDDRNDREVLLHRQMNVGHRLRLDALRGINDQQRAFARAQAARHFIGKIHVPGRIDTPGHVDFSYEVSRSLAACEGALLIVDAAQGVEAQTVANVHLATKQNLAIIPVINKVDLPNADIPNVKHQLEEVLAIPAEEAVLASAKTGIGIADILEAIIHRIPAPADTTGLGCAR